MELWLVFAQWAGRQQQEAQETLDKQGREDIIDILDVWDEKRGSMEDEKYVYWYSVAGENHAAHRQSVHDAKQDAGGFTSNGNIQRVCHLPANH